MKNCKAQTKKNTYTALAVVSGIFTIGMCMLLVKESSKPDSNPWNYSIELLCVFAGVAACAKALIKRCEVDTDQPLLFASKSPEDLMPKFKYGSMVKPPPITLYVPKNLEDASTADLTDCCVVSRELRKKYPLFSLNNFNALADVGATKDNSQLLKV